MIEASLEVSKFRSSNLLEVKLMEHQEKQQFYTLKTLIQSHAVGNTQSKFFDSSTMDYQGSEGSLHELLPLGTDQYA